MLCVLGGGGGGRKLTTNDQEGREGYFRRHCGFGSACESCGSRGDGPISQERREDLESSAVRRGAQSLLYTPAWKSIPQNQRAEDSDSCKEGGFDVETWRTAVMGDWGRGMVGKFLKATLRRWIRHVLRCFRTLAKAWHDKASQQSPARSAGFRGVRRGGFSVEIEQRSNGTEHSQRRAISMERAGGAANPAHGRRDRLSRHT